MVSGDQFAIQTFCSCLALWDISIWRREWNVNVNGGGRGRDGRDANKIHGVVFIRRQVFIWAKRREAIMADPQDVLKGKVWLLWKRCPYYWSIVEEYAIKGSVSGTRATVKLRDDASVQRKWTRVPESWIPSYWNRWRKGLIFLSNELFWKISVMWYAI